MHILRNPGPQFTLVVLQFDQAAHADSIAIIDDDKNPRGSLEPRVSRVLAPLLCRPRFKVELQSYIDHQLSQIHVNIYAMKEATSTIGKHLARNRLYLQHPIQPLLGYEYSNPHYYANCAETKLTNHFWSDSENDREQVPNEVQISVQKDTLADSRTLFDEVSTQVLHQDINLVEIEQDCRITTSLLP